MASDNKVVSDVKLQKIVDKLRAIKDRQQLNEEQTKNGLFCLYLQHLVMMYSIYFI